MDDKQNASQNEEKDADVGVSTYKQCPECGMNMLIAIRQCPKCNHKFRSEEASLASDENMGSPAHPAGQLNLEQLQSAPGAANYKQCPACNMSMAAAVGQCPSCGHKFKTQFAPKQVSHTMAVACVSCGNPGVLKLSTLTDSPEEAQRAGVADRERLVKQVALPPEPQYEAPRSFIAVAVFGIVAVVGLAGYAVAPQTFLLVVGGVSGIIAAGAGIMALQAKAKAQADYAAQEARWKEMRQQWNMLFYCSRCHQISDLMARKAIAPDKVQITLLRSAPSGKLNRHS